jgi:chromosome segregation ATPase
VRRKNGAIICCLVTLSFFYAVALDPTTAQNAARAEAAREDERQLLQALLAEVRQMRHAFERVGFNSGRLQITIDRWRSQREFVHRLSRELEESRNESSSLGLLKAQVEERLKDLEGRVQQARDEEVRDALQMEQKDLKREVEQQSERISQLTERQMRLTNTLQTERLQLDELRGQLSSLEQEMEAQMSPGDHERRR